jgi:protein-S-isoprenylcysteine O-methyltransferase Ste14
MWWPMFLASILFFLAGTEIRLRSEDRLLESRFQDSFRAYRSHNRTYRSRIRAYIPFVR